MAWNDWTFTVGCVTVGSSFAPPSFISYTSPRSPAANTRLPRAKTPWMSAVSVGEMSRTVSVAASISRARPFDAPPTAYTLPPVPCTVKSVSVTPLGTTLNAPPFFLWSTVPAPPTAQTSSPSPHTLKSPGDSPLSVLGRSSGRRSSLKDVPSKCQMKPSRPLAPPTA